MKLIPILALIAALLPLVSCEPASRPLGLVGHWQYESGSKDKKPEDMELLKDGTGVCDGDSILWKVKNKNLIIQSPSFNIVSDYKLILENRLILTDNSKKSTYVNINKSYKRGIFTDSRDNKRYWTIKIGDQTWMAGNLNYNAEGSKYYNKDERFGRLYYWDTAMEACPSGWHLPSNTEWQSLVDFAGGEEIAGGKLKAKYGWAHYNGDYYGTNAFGFSALPSGYNTPCRLPNYMKKFLSVSRRRWCYNGEFGSWWSSTEYENDTSCAYYWEMYYDDTRIEQRRDFSKKILLSVRCVQD